jgi:hypothetical protein
MYLITVTTELANDVGHLRYSVTFIAANRTGSEPGRSRRMNCARPTNAASSQRESHMVPGMPWIATIGRLQPVAVKDSCPARRSMVWGVGSRWGVRAH